jgi:hypothetical protein
MIGSSGVAVEVGVGVAAGGHSIPGSGVGVIVEEATISGVDMCIDVGWDITQPARQATRNRLIRTKSFLISMYFMGTFG